MAGIICISGCDTSGGAGISADIRAIASRGFECYPVITSVACQTHEGVSAVLSLSPAKIYKQLETTILMEPKAVKVGLAHDSRSISAIADIIEKHPMPIVMDPVQASSSSNSLVDPDQVHALKQRLIPMSSIIMPNLPEAEALSGIKPDSEEGIHEICRVIHALGAKNVLVKGGHGRGNDLADIFFDGKDFFTFTDSRIPGNYRGTGCSLSALTACGLAQGYSVIEAVKAARKDLRRAIQKSHDTYPSHENHILFMHNSGGK